MSGVQIVPYSVACAALAQAKSVDDVKDIADKAEAMRVYAKRAKNRDLELDAAEIRIRAERRLGEMLADLKRVGVLSNGGQPLQSRGQPPLDGSRVTLRALGVDHKLSMKAQHLARIEPDRFETQLHDLRVRSERGTGRAPVTLRPSSHRNDHSPYEFRVNGRRLGSVAVGEIDGLVASIASQSLLLRSIKKHCRPADSLTTVEDLLTPSDLSRLLAAAKGEA
ncbi:hypothetical protein FFI89_018800 [Bradyrhizobium sp. KBS0727]|uniref:hypothetical protein n=1 Tax=unclassified Bradyrhizobium TaxID=2631580 RepID=UPI00110ECE17|nr:MULTISPECIES: hypothetical protein [unclassified Bradyrhizobium]QDW39015.1 hypothetical protein FFI71_018800 [Bradyrhizobium sp. KBS0725]QDW45618.1 hypothetical protein FFI89_018800 [Bradyrhizobium sp. KBS0727]